MDKIAVIGLGYVGLPLAHAFANKYSVVGFDVAQQRINELARGYDRTLELSNEQVKEAIDGGMQFTCNLEDIAHCNIYIVTVPTPVDKNKRPDLTALIKASESIGAILKKGDIVIYESTVYPGATEEDCVPVLEKQSGLVFNKDFFCGYSPERINPGDKVHTITKIIKVTSGSTPEIAQKVDQLYKTVITAGTFLAPSIKVAEAAKVIENSQRDINIAFVNELAIIFNKIGINTNDVLDAAGSKWNFLPFKPGLVGGHCIGVDPYYLTHKAQEIGYNPEIILAGRRLNDGMGIYVANQVIKLMIKKNIHVLGAKILIMGLAFKENCPDCRNSRVFDLVSEFESFKCHVDIFDPWVDKEVVLREYGYKLIDEPGGGKYDVVLLAVAHDVFKEISLEKIRKFGKDSHVLYDIKNLFKFEGSDGKL
jgi:UDP-N-acetyl-D-glucosamine/UDP-N-acetyl-D-galactosamine dehydrogenase